MWHSINLYLIFYQLLEIPWLINHFSISISFQADRNFSSEKTKKPTKSTFAKTLPNSILTCASFIGAWRKKRIYYRRLCIYTLAEAFSEKASSSHQISLMSFPLHRLPFRLRSTVMESFKGFHSNWRFLKTLRDCVYNREKNIGIYFWNFLTKEKNMGYLLHLLNVHVK